MGGRKLRRHVGFAVISHRGSETASAIDIATHRHVHLCTDSDFRKLRRIIPRHVVLLPYGKQRSRQRVAPLVPRHLLTSRAGPSFGPCARTRAEGNRVSRNADILPREGDARSARTSQQRRSRQLNFQPPTSNGNAPKTD